MGKYQRTKGHNFERVVAGILRQFWPDAARGYQTRFGTKEAPDVDHTPFYIECKIGKRTNIKGALEQAEKATDGRPILAVTKDDRKPILVTMQIDTFIGIMRGDYVLPEGRREDSAAQGGSPGEAARD